MKFSHLHRLNVSCIGLSNLYIMSFFKRPSAKATCKIRLTIVSILHPQANGRQ